MARPYCGVAYSNAVYDEVRLRAVINLIVEVVESFTGPALNLVEPLQDGAPDDIPAHVHRHKTGREERPVLVAIDFFEDKAEHGRGDERAAVLPNFAYGVAGEIVSVQESHQVLEYG